MMLPLQQFQSFVAQHKLFTSSDKILLAVSGGKDSVLMSRLFNEAGINFGIAHCNFNLREDESEADQAFTAALAEKYGVPFHYVRFDTLQRAEKGKISIQMAARELRYEWFESIRQQFGYQYIALAHHQNDLVETVLLNLVRGTGISGLHGILPKRQYLIRPLLFLSRQQIDEIVAEENISYREDSSNLSTKYARNKIRLEVIPELKELNPALEETFRQNSSRFAELEELLRLRTEELRSVLFKPYSTNSFVIEVEELKKLYPQKLLLYELFKPYLFSEAVLKDLADAWEGQPGKQFESATHRIVTDRGKIFLMLRDHKAGESALIRRKDTEVSGNNYVIRISEASPDNISWKKNADIAYVDAALLEFPLILRSWKKGDYFYPFGMKGRQKLSDFFTARKIPLADKDRIPILENKNGDIIWIAGCRSDERYRITAETKKVIIFEIISKNE